MKATPRQTNVVVIHCHDLGRHLNCLGAESVRTPHLDEFARDGVVFGNVFATAPQCSPSRASLFTGRWPHVNGVMGLTHRGFGWDLNPDEVHLAAHLSAAGYATEMLGVHHESRVLDDAAVAERLGFEHYLRGGMAEVLAGRAEETIARLASGDRPFYLQVGFFEPHRLGGARDADGTMGFLGDHVEPDSELGVSVPAYLQDTPLAREEIAELQGAVRHLDAGVGRVLDAIRAAGVEEQTLVVFTTDHGLALPRAKCSLYDPGLEVAFIVRQPDRGWVGGRRHEALLSNVDVTPTILAAVGVTPVQGSPAMHGRSFLGLLDDAAYTPREEVYAELTYHDYYDPRRCVRTDRWKLIANFSSAPGFMDPTQSWNRRCVPVAEASHNWDEYHPTFELYDLESDPLELTDLALDPTLSEVVDDLRDRLARWMCETEDPLLDGAVTGPLHRSTTTQLTTSALLSQ